MKPFNRKSLGPFDQKKWGLFILLLGSLGFSLSMNPDHFNNIVRNDLDSGTFELALTQAEEAKIAKSAPSAKAEPAKKEKHQADTTTDDRDDQDIKKLREEAEAKAKLEQEEKAKLAKAATPAPNTKVLTEEELDKRIKETAEAAAKAATGPQLEALKKELIAEIRKNNAMLPESAKPQPVAATQPQANPNAKPTEVGAASANGAGTAAAPVLPPGQTANPTHKLSFDLLDKGISCDVEVAKDGADVKGKVTSKTEAGPCKNGKTYTLKSGITDLENIRKELLAKMKEDNSDKTEKELAKEKIDKVKTEFEAQVKTKCRKKGMEYADKLECVRDLLISMTEKIDSLNLDDSNSNIAKLAVKNFFSKNVLPEIRLGMNSQTVTFDIYGRPMADTSKLDAANEASLHLLENMSPDSSQDITQMLAKARAGSYTAQAGYAKNLYLEAQDDKKDPMRFQIGVMKENIAKMNLNPTTLNWTLARDGMAWNNALADGGKGSQQGYLQTGLMTPVKNFISQLPKMDLYGKLDANKQDLAAQQLAQMQFGDLGGGMNYPGLGTPFTPGMGYSGIPSALLASRLDAQVRGLEIPLITTPRGVTTGTVNGRALPGQLQQNKTTRTAGGRGSGG